MSYLKKSRFMLFAVLLCSFSIFAADTDYVSRIADGRWTSSVIYKDMGQGMRHIVEMQSVWVDIKVKNVTYVKTVGIIWSTDGWNTNNVTQAKYEGDLGGGYEKWGVDFGQFDTDYATKFEYAIFTKMNGVTYYDNNSTKNYVIKLINGI